MFKKLEMINGFLNVNFEVYNIKIFNKIFFNHH